MKIFFNAILFIFFYATPLHLAIEKGNIEIVRLLLSKPNLNINSKYIQKVILFHTILKHYFFISFLLKNL